MPRNPTTWQAETGIRSSRLLAVASSRPAGAIKQYEVCSAQQAQGVQKPGVAAHACNPSMGRAETGRL